MRRRRPGFGLQVYVMQIVLITVVAVVFASLAINGQVERVRRDNEADIRASALTGSTLPSVVDGLLSPDPQAAIQPVVEALREASGVDYVTVVDMDNIRVAHTNPDLVGSPVSSDHSSVRAGNEFVGVETGPTGRTFRVKEPVRGPDGAVVGTISLGIAETRLTEDVVERSTELVLVAAAAVALGAVLAWAATRLVKRRLYGVDPEDIPALLSTRDSVLGGIGDGLVLLDAEGRVVLANEAAGQIVTGRGEASEDGRVGEQGDATGTVAGAGAVAGTGAGTGEGGLHVGADARDVLPRSVIALLDAVAGNEARPRAEDLTIRDRRVAVTVWPATVEGKPVGTTLLLQDRTDLLLALDELQDQRARLRSMRRETHEFDNRLHVLGGLLSLGRYEEAAQLLTGAVNDCDDDDAAYGDVAGSALARIEDPVLAALLHSLEQRGRARGIAVEITEDSAVGVDGDPAAPTVVGNLITNALEVARSQVRVYVRSDDEGLAILVEDDGPGVPAALRAEIFDEGFSTKPAGRSGRGIGLHLVRSLVASRGGDIVVGSCDLGGAAFSVDIPAPVPARTEEVAS